MSKHTDITAFEANICPELAFSNDYYTMRTKVILDENFPDHPTFHLADFIHAVLKEIWENNYADAVAVIIAEFDDFSSIPILQISKRLGEVIKAEWIISHDEYERIFR